MRLLVKIEGGAKIGTKIGTVRKDKIANYLKVAKSQRFLTRKGFSHAKIIALRYIHSYIHTYIHTYMYILTTHTSTQVPSKIHMKLRN